MWEKIKENGFNIVSIGIVSANLFLFALIALQGIVRIWEPTKEILALEIALCLFVIAWGIERLVKDL